MMSPRQTLAGKWRLRVDPNGIGERNQNIL